MENIIYYVAVFLTVGIAGYGALLIVLSVYEIIRGFIRRNSNETSLLNSVHLVNGILNLCVGGVLFWLLEPSGLSSYSTVAIVSIFSLVEGFIRRYYTKRLEPK